MANISRQTSSDTEAAIMSVGTSGASISFGLGSRKPSRPVSNGLKRPHSALLDNEDDEHSHGKAQHVSHFDHKAGGAIDANRPKERGPLVIPAIKNRDWKEASKQKRQRSALPSRNQVQNNASVEAAERAVNQRVFGLNVMSRDEPDAEQQTENEASTNGGEIETVQERTVDDRALDALLGVETTSSNLVISATSETDAFQSDYKTAPDVATLDDYTAMPVEEFGAAMLRGMGWKDGDGVGTNKDVKVKKIQELKRRPALLGIGAKSDAAVDAELGGWGKASRGREIKIYNPVLLKDKKTGELFTEEELEKRKEQVKNKQYEEEFEKQERDRERRRQKDRDHDRESRRRHDEGRSHRRDDDREYRRSDDDHRRRDKDRDRDYDRKRDSRGDHSRRDNHNDDRDGERSHREDDRDRRHRRDDDYNRRRHDSRDRHESDRRRR